MNEYMVQAIGFLGVALFIISYQIRSNRALFLCQLMGCIVFCVQFFSHGRLYRRNQPHRQYCEKSAADKVKRLEVGEKPSDFSGNHFAAAGYDNMHLGRVDEHLALCICSGYQYRILDTKCPKDPTVTIVWFPVYASLRYIGTHLGRRCLRGNYDPLHHHFHCSVWVEKFGGRIWGGLKTSDRSAFIRIHFRKGAIKNGFFQWLNNAYGGGQNPAAHIPDGAPAALVRRRCRFSGLVEGVGFRYETQRIASQLGLSGWVQNQSNGSVVVEIEGPANYIEAFLMAVEAVSRFDITDIQAEDLPPTKAETAFRVLL